MRFIEPERLATLMFSRRRFLGAAAGLTAAAGLDKLSLLPDPARGAQPTPANALLCYFNSPTPGWYTSVDDAQSFQLLNANPLPASPAINGFAVFQGDLWMLVILNNFPQNNTLHVQTSTDQGVSWADVFAVSPVQPPGWCWLDSDVQMLFMVNTAQDHVTVIASKNKFATTTTFDGTPTNAFGDGQANRLARDPTNGRFMSRSSLGASVISDDGGVSWTVGSPDGQPAGMSMMFNPGIGTPVGIGNGNITGKTIYQGSGDGAGLWTPVFTSGAPGTFAQQGAYSIISAPFVRQKPATKTLALWVDTSLASWRAVQTTSGSTWSDLGSPNLPTGIDQTSGFWQLPSGNWLLRRGQGGLFRSTDGLNWTAPTVGGGTGSLSVTWPVLTSTTIPFAAFTARVDIVRSAQAFDARGTFTLGAGGSFDLSKDAVTVQLKSATGSTSITIPPGSFQLVRGRYVFFGILNNMPVEGAIVPLGGGHYAYEIGASGDPSVVPITNPVTVTLTVGNNSGSATVTANII